MGLFTLPSVERAASPDGESRFVLPLLGQQSVSSYSSIDGSRPMTALQSVAVGATVDLIASLSSELPIDVFIGEGKAQRKQPTPGFLLDIQGDGHGTPDVIYQTVVSWLLRGNLYADVLQHDREGRPTQWVPYFPDDVSCRTEGGTVKWFVKGREVEDMSRFMHVRVKPMPGSILGQSAIAMHAATIGVSLAATRFGGQWFTDGAHPTALLTTDDSLTKKQAITAKERFLAVFSGKREPLVLGNGWDYKPLQMNPEESQFLQTQGYSEAQCARIFGPGFSEILGYESGGNLTYANIESRATHLLVFGMNRWLTRLERLLSSMVPGKQYVKINRDAMLETTTLTRYQAYASAIQNKWKTVNEVRDDEDMAPVAWGDEPVETQNQQAAPATGGN